MSKAAAVQLWIGPDGWLAERIEAARRTAEEWDRIRPDERTPGRMYEAVRSFSFFQMARTVCIEGPTASRTKSGASLSRRCGRPRRG